ncbi:Putative Pectinesterase (fragment) [Candidatus Sulfopaludibacter sp. SbA3]
MLQYSNNNVLNNGNSRAQFGVDASDFTLENISLHNTTPHGGSQAESFRGNNNRILLNRVNLSSYQDTLMLQGAALVTDSYIEGDVDFMWGNGAVFLQYTELKALTSSGYYTQIRNGQGQNGYVFLNCTLSAANGVTGSYLARIDPTVFPYSQVIYIKSLMGPQIIPAGWLLNNATTAPNVQFWEYQSYNLAGTAFLDVSQRAPFSRQLSAPEAAQWSDPGFVLGGWVPYTVNITTSTVAVGGSVTIDYSAASGHNTKDTIGLFLVGDPNSNVLSPRSIGSTTTGQIGITVPARAGQYEVRYILSDGVTVAAKSNVLTVQ